MIDCDIHHVIGDQDEFLSFMDPGQREWFKTRGDLGLPGYPWSHPFGFAQEDGLFDSGHAPGALERISREALDAYGADLGILHANDASTVSLMASPYRAAAFARAHNDWVRERWLDGEPRLRGSILCPAQDPLAAAREIQRAAATDDRFVEVLLCAGSERPYGEPRYLPIFEAAAECGLQVAIHTSGEGMGIAAPGGGVGPHTFYIEWHTVGSATSVMSHLVSLICNGIFERLPTLKVMLLEGGIAWLPGLLWRLDTNWRGLRAEVPWLERRPSEIMRDHVRFSTQPLEHTDGNDRLLFEMLESAGAPDILCFASDYPHWDWDDPRFVINRLPKEWRQQVMHDNAAAFYGSKLGLQTA
jgi:predicted TIM-barrel fold metal-dependent hydrolase